MPYKDIEKSRESNRKSYQKNKEKRLLAHKKWSENNIDKLKKYSKDYQKNNRSKINEKAVRRRAEDQLFRKKKNDYSKEWRIKNSEKMAIYKKKSILKNTYGISVKEFDSMINKQKGGCALCGKSNPRSNNKTGLCIDHNHATGKVRGLLCDKCNRGLGLFNEDVDVLKKAIIYLQK